MDEQTKMVDDAEKADFDFDSKAGVEAQLDDESNLEHALDKPIMAHGEQVRFLKWREPTGLDIEMAGNPIIVDFFGEKPSLTFNEKKMSAMISQLCKIPPSSVRQLTAADWNSVAWKLVRFFMPRTAG